VIAVAEERPAGPLRELPGAAMARFWEARGRRVFEALGVLWAEYRGPFFISLPFERRLDLDPRELGAALRGARVTAVRFPTATQPGWPCALYVLSPAGYSLRRVERRRRRRVRRGLDVTECRRLEPDELLAHGLALNLETMARQRRFDPEFGDPARWRRFVLAASRCPEVSITGGFLDGRLSCYLIGCRDGAWLHCLYRASRTAELARDTAVALDFWTLSQAASDPSLRAIEAGFAPVVSGDTSHLYKMDLGFTPEPVALGIRFHPALQPILSSGLCVAAASALLRLRPRSRRLERVAKVLRGARLSRAEGGG
jgi:hypothetical protein